MQPNTKKCSSCKENKLFCEFSASPKGKFGLHNYCRGCLKKYNKTRYEENRADMIGQAREWQENNPEKSKEIKRNWWAKNNGQN